jgi:hypothetical protein
MPLHIGKPRLRLKCRTHGKLGDAGHVELNENPTSPYWETCAVLAACSNIVVSAVLMSAGVFAV